MPFILPPTPPPAPPSKPAPHQHQLLPLWAVCRPPEGRKAKKKTPRTIGPSCVRFSIAAGWRGVEPPNRNRLPSFYCSLIECSVFFLFPLFSFRFQSFSRCKNVHHILWPPRCHRRSKYVTRTCLRKSKREGQSFWLF